MFGQSAALGAVLDDGGRHGLRCRGAKARIDVEAIGLVADGDDFRAQFMEHVRGDMVGGAMRAIDDDLQAAQVQLVREGALAKFDVAALGIVEALGAAQRVYCLQEGRIALQGKTAELTRESISAAYFGV